MQEVVVKKSRADTEGVVFQEEEIVSTIHGENYGSDERYVTL